MDYATYEPPAKVKKTEKDYPYELRLAPSLIEFRAFVDDLIEDGFVAFDIETSGLDPYLNEPLLLQFSKRVNERGICECAVLYARDVNKSPELRAEISRLLTNKKVVVIGHNLSFDYKFVLRHYGIEIATMHDTRMADAVLNMGRGYKTNLHDVADRVLDLELDKTEQKSFIGMKPEDNFTASQIHYAAFDVVILFDLMDKQMHEARSLGCQKVVRLENMAVAATAHLELNGVLIDLEQWSVIAKDYHIRRMKAFKAILKELSIEEPKPKNIDQLMLFGVKEPLTEAEEIDLLKSAFNPGSSVQIKSQLAKMGIHVESTMSGNLEPYKDNKFVELLMEYKKMDKAISAFMDPIPLLMNQGSGRWHPSYIQLQTQGEGSDGGTTTGRYSSKNFNYQQLPKDKAIRKCFVARPGWSIVTADYAAMEVRIAGNLTGEPVLIDFFNSDLIDFHGYMASIIFDKPLAEVSKFRNDKGEEIDPPDVGPRGITKIATFGLFYGSGYKGLARTLKMDEEYCKGVINDYNTKMPRLMNGLRAIGREAARQGYVQDRFGRIKFFDLPKDASDKDRLRVERQSQNMPIQAINASQTKFALALMLERLPRDSFRLYATVHDEIVCEVRNDMVEEHMNAIRQIMIEAASRVLPGPIHYDVSCVVKPYWTK